MHFCHDVRARVHEYTAAGGIIEIGTGKLKSFSLLIY